MKHKRSSILMGIIFLSCITISCDTKNKNADYPIPIQSVIVSERDTITLEDTFKAKVFLNSNLLYLQAKKQGIKNYLKVSFWNGNPDFKLGEPIMIGDTAFIEFKIDYLDSLSKDTVNAFYWENAFFINFDKSHEGYDTTFTTRSAIYVKY